jgi:hypothetical protein
MINAHMVRIQGRDHLEDMFLEETVWEACRKTWTGLGDY